MAGETNINVLNLVAQKKQANEQAVMAAAPVSGAIDERGKVSLWLISQKKWAKFWPVDAMDILKSGTANLTGPEEEIKEVEAENNQEPEPDEDKEKANPKTGKLEDGTVVELRKLAKDRDIELGNLTLKADIIEKIRAESENPPEGPGKNPVEDQE